MAAHPNTQRSEALAALGTTAFDIVVIGGGITGAGIARDAVLRGLTVALVEKDDFASGTSSKSTKLIHGGLRYLEQFELKLVFESVNERKRLMKLARHLVRPQAFLVTNYKRDPRWLLTLDIGLWLYEALCFFQAYKNHRTHRARKVKGIEPWLTDEGLNGGIVYYDCITDDARLTLENALDARALGAVVLNHVKAERLVKDDTTGAVRGVEVVDEESGAKVAVRARVVINAGGPWSDEIRAMLGDAPILKPTKGVHIVVDAKRLWVNHALMLSAQRDRRAVFVIPWQLGRTVVGTTDTFFDGSPDKVEPTKDDIDYLLETANHYFPDSKLVVDDVLATWSGLRPLLKPPEATGASKVSREHMLYEQPGFLTIAGGKLTTYRSMAMEVVDHAMKQLGLETASTTATRPLPGAVGLSESDEQFESLKSALGNTVKAKYFAETYGTRAVEVLARGKADATAAQPLDQELPFVMAQVDEAVEHELARTLDDVLSRRVPLILRGRDQGLAVAQTVAERMGKQLGWSAQRTQNELARYREAVASSRAFRAAKVEQI